MKPIVGEVWVGGAFQKTETNSQSRQSVSVLVRYISDWYLPGFL